MSCRIRPGALDVIFFPARSATHDVVRTVVATLVRSTRAGVLSWHRIGWLLLRSQRWRVDISISVDTITQRGDAIPSA